MFRVGLKSQKRLTLHTSPALVEESTKYRFSNSKQCNSRAFVIAPRMEGFRSEPVGGRAIAAHPGRYYTTRYVW